MTPSDDVDPPREPVPYTGPERRRTPQPQRPAAPDPASRPPPRQRVSFSEDFRRFFVRGAAALLPTLITLWLVFGIIDFLWENLGQHIITGIKHVWLALAESGLVPYEPPGYIGRYWSSELLRSKIVGVLLAIIAVYIVGVLVGNFIGRAAWRLAEQLVMKIPLVRAIYPAVKQVTDFVLADRSARQQSQFAGSRVVAVHHRDTNIWTVGLVTGQGLRDLASATGEELVTVFVPSSPTAFSGYVVVAPRSAVVELPLTVEEAMRLLISGGVLDPKAAPEGRRSAGLSLAGPPPATDVAGGAVAPAPQAPRA